MSLLATLEKHLSRFAVPGLIRYVVALNALVFLLGMANPGYVQALTLDRQAILSGEVWRLVSWIFIPTVSGLIWVLFYLLVTWQLGEMIESTWGTFRLNLYYVTGYLGCTAAALVFGQSLANVALNSSLLFAAGTLLPNLQMLLFGILPIKLKWIALVSAVLLSLSLLAGDWGTRAALLVCFANYALFFGPALLRDAAQRREINARRARFEVAQVPATETLHRCEVCGRTEVSNPELDFRVSTDGHEYCTAHLPARRN